jgi:hypothetical protein
MEQSLGVNAHIPVLQGGRFKKKNGEKTAQQGRNQEEKVE